MALGASGREGDPEDEPEAAAPAARDHRLHVAPASGAAPLVASGWGERAASSPVLLLAALGPAGGALWGARDGTAAEDGEAAALAELLGRGA
jgi:hypothetical protein